MDNAETQLRLLRKWSEKAFPLFFRIGNVPSLRLEHCSRCVETEEGTADSVSNPAIDEFVSAALEAGAVGESFWVRVAAASC